MTLVDKTWLDLKPNEDLNGNQEWFDEYYARIQLKKDFKHIPKIVYEQWIHPHHQNFHTLKNYAWLNFENIEFSINEWKTSAFSNLNIIKSFKDYYANRSSYSSFEQFCCTDSDLKYWKRNGTWRIAPIIIDVNSLTEKIPLEAELNGSFQLVEGHSRLGYLNSLIRISSLNKGKIASTHQIILMHQK